MERLFFVGPGRFTLALAQALVEVSAVERLVICGRHPEPPSHPLFVRGGVEYVYGLRRPEADTTAVFLAVPDDDLAEMAWAVGGQGNPGAPIPVFHASLSTGTEVLAPLHGQGYTVGCFHPFVALDRSFEAARRLFGAPVLLSGERGARATGRRLVQALGGRVVELPVTRRPSASAAEAMLLGGARTLGDLGTRLFEEAGLPTVDARRVAGALLRTVGDALDDPTNPAPGVDPRDEEIDLHLRALPEGMRELYRALLDFEPTQENGE